MGGRSCAYIELLPNLKFSRATLWKLGHKRGISCAQNTGFTDRILAPEVGLSPWRRRPCARPSDERCIIDVDALEKSTGVKVIPIYAGEKDRASDVDTAMKETRSMEITPTKEKDSAIGASTTLKETGNTETVAMTPTNENLRAIEKKEKNHRHVTRRERNRRQGRASIKM